MATPPPDLDFLSLNGTPDPRRPRAPSPESQLPLITHFPETPATPEDLTSLDPKIRGPENMGESVNYPKHEISGMDFLGLNENYPEPVVPGGLQPAPNQVEDPYWHELGPESQTFLRVLEKSGRVTKAAELAGKSRGYFYALKDKDRDFARLWHQATKYRAELLEDEAIRRAVNGVKETIFYMGAPCGQKTVYSDSLLSKLLEGNMPQKYRQNHKVELEGNLGVATLVLPATTTAEEWAAQNSGTIIEQEPEDKYA